MSMLSAQCDKLRELATRFDEIQSGATRVVRVSLDSGSVLRDAAHEESIQQALMGEVGQLEAENAKLLVERDEWHRVAVSKQDIIDHMRDTSTSNMRLRELCADMFDGMCDHDSCNICPHWREGYNGCEYHERMAQLGVEVD